MKCPTIILLLLPALLCAQELQFRQEFDSIPVEINGWQTFAPFGGGESVLKPKFCDIDADGDLDLFIGNYNGFITYYENEGTNQAASFRLITRAWNGINLANLTYFAHTAPVFCDLDGDGDYDFFTGDGIGLIHYWQNIGTSQNPEFTFITDSLENIDGSGFNVLQFIDIDSDGDFDLFMGGYNGTIWFYRNEGNATTWDLVLITSQFANIDVGYCSSPCFVDIDADGDQDLFIGNMAGNIWYYRNDGDSINYNFTFVTDFYDSIWVDSYAAPELADIDADGDYDLFVGRENEANPNSPGDLFFYENMGNAQVPQWQLITYNYLSLDQGARSQNHHADIEADGDYDLFSANQNDRISYYQNIGSATSASFQWVTDSYQDLVVNSGTIYFADIDADQDSDLFIGEALVPNPPYPGLYLFQNRGTPQNASFSLYSNNLVPWSYHVRINQALADIDGDGDLDLFISDNQDTRYFYENVGSPTSPVFGSPSFGWFGAFPSDTLTTTQLLGYCFYDIDSDGDLDMFGYVSSWDDHSISFYRNEGTAQSPNFILQTENLIILERPDSFLGIDILDIDMDGDGDMILSLSLDGGMYFFRNITGEPPGVPPPVYRHPRAGMQLILGPNPANPLTVISLSLPCPQEATLAVYNLLGAKITTLASGLQPAGTRTFLWDARGNASGIYIVRLEAGGESLANKLLITK